jgi:hypothetical protein
LHRVENSIVVANYVSKKLQMQLRMRLLTVRFYWMRTHYFSSKTMKRASVSQSKQL